jgi:hypothetical protein
MPDVDSWRKHAVSHLKRSKIEKSHSKGVLLGIGSAPHIVRAVDVLLQEESKDLYQGDEIIERLERACDKWAEKNIPTKAFKENILVVPSGIILLQELLRHTMSPEAKFCCKAVHTVGDLKVKATWTAGSYIRHRPSYANLSQASKNRLGMNPNYLDSSDTARDSAREIQEEACLGLLCRSIVSGSATLLLARDVVRSLLEVSLGGLLRIKWAEFSRRAFQWAVLGSSTTPQSYFEFLEGKWFTHVEEALESYRAGPHNSGSALESSSDEPTFWFKKMVKEEVANGEQHVEICAIMLEKGGEIGSEELSDREKAFVQVALLRQKMSEKWVGHFPTAEDIDEKLAKEKPKLPESRVGEFLQLSEEIAIIMLEPCAGITRHSDAPRRFGPLGGYESVSCSRLCQIGSKTEDATDSPGVLHVVPLVCEANENFRFRKLQLAIVGHCLMLKLLDSGEKLDLLEIHRPYREFNKCLEGQSENREDLGPGYVQVVSFMELMLLACIDGFEGHREQRAQFEKFWVDRVEKDIALKTSYKPQTDLCLGDRSIGKVATQQVLFSLICGRCFPLPCTLSLTCIPLSHCFLSLFCDSRARPPTNEQELGRGQFGMVTLGEWKARGTKVAIKTLFFPRIVWPDVIHEIKTNDLVRHRHCVGLEGVVVGAEQLQIIQELCECGGDLQKMIKKQPMLLLSRFWRFAAQLAEAATHLHKIGIVHRDIKPANVLLTKDYRSCKVCDFGMSKKLECQADLEQSLSAGTPVYNPPENFMWRDERGQIVKTIVHTDEEQAKKHDIYSLALSACPRDKF